jgi:dihydroorotate dehydrogenase
MHRTLTFAPLHLLRRLDPETAHALALGAIRLGLAGRPNVAVDPILQVAVFGLEFRNPIGLAAGFDKNGAAIDGLARLGFGFLETGTVTPRAQSGNPRPRVFRLEEDGAVINRLGFNNSGLDAYLERLASRTTRTVPIGANVGINRDHADPERDYPALVEAVTKEADYIVVNVSSPNTADLRSWQSPPRLETLLRSIATVRRPTRPLLLKVSPDLAEGELEALIEICISGGVQGLILTNTTVARPETLRSRFRDELGGLSGAPLFAPSTAMLARAFELARGRMKLIGVGGVRSGRDALMKIQAGAHLVQLYTAFAYGGADLLHRALDELAAELQKRGFKSVEEAVGSDARRLARS